MSCEEISCLPFLVSCFEIATEMARRRRGEQWCYCCVDASLQIGNFQVDFAEVRISHKLSLRWAILVVAVVDAVCFLNLN